MAKYTVKVTVGNLSATQANDLADFFETVITKEDNKKLKIKSIHIEILEQDCKNEKNQGAIQVH